MNNESNKKTAEFIACVLMSAVAIVIAVAAIDYAVEKIDRMNDHIVHIDNHGNRTSDTFGSLEIEDDY